MAKAIYYPVQFGDGPETELHLPVSDEVAEFLEQDRKREAAQGRSDRRHLSKNNFEQTPERRKPIGDADGLEGLAVLNIRKQVLRDAICALADGEQDLLRRYYWEEQTMEQIGSSLGISKTAVSKRLKKLYGKLRDSVF